jgi:hypothetical protein
LQFARRHGLTEMPNYGYHFARAEGAFVRRIYRALLPMILRRTVQPRGLFPLEVFSYSGEATLPEQIASIRSFLKHAGRPKQFTIVSDGTHSAASIELLKRVDLSVSVARLPEVSADLPAELRSYLTTHPTGKQLALIMSLPRKGPALYVDSDVLFFPQAHDLSALANTHNVSAFYLADCQLSGDERLLRGPNENQEPVNTGVLLLFKALDWSLCIQRFLELNGAPNFFTNQTMTHLTMHANRALPLDQTRYVLRLDDQCIYRDRYAGNALALRHYVNPVRHKFWTTLWRRRLANP